MSDILKRIEELKEQVSDSTNKQDVEFPLEFYPLKEQAIMQKLVASKGLNMQHLGISMLPAYGRIYSEYTANAFNGAHKVFPIFWVGIVDNPGSTKSATMDAFYQPLSEFNVYSEEEGNILYTATNTTIEGLSYALSGKKTGIYLMYDELMTFIGSMGVYRQGGNSNYDKTSWLSLFNGKPAQILRASRGISFVERQVVGVGGTLQPKVLKTMFDKSDMENGFFDRFLWSVQSNGYPNIIRDPDHSIDGAVSDMIAEHIHAPKFHKELKFSKAAQDYLFDWHEEWRNKIQNKKGTPEYNFFGKRIVYINRFALISELMHSKGSETTEISLASAERAVMLDTFCDAMRMSAYELAFESGDEVTESMLDIRNISRWFFRNYPNTVKKTFAEIIGVSRPTLDNYLK